MCLVHTCVHPLQVAAFLCTYFTVLYSVHYYSIFISRPEYPEAYVKAAVYGKIC